MLGFVTRNVFHFIASLVICIHYYTSKLVIIIAWSPSIHTTDVRVAIQVFKILDGYIVIQTIHILGSVMSSKITTTSASNVYARTSALSDVTIRLINMLALHTDHFNVSYE